MSPLVSVIVPTYNVETYISECLESILDQTVKDIEVIIVDDGSHDKTVEVVAELAEQHSNIQVIKQKNQGVSVARNTGMSVAKGKYISFIDSDDKIQVDFLKNLYQIAEKEQADIVRGSFRDFSGQIPKGWVADFDVETGPGLVVLEQFWSASVSPVIWSSLFRTEFLKNNQLHFTPHMLMEDAEFIAEAYMKATKVATSSDINYLYRVRSGSLVNSNNSQLMSESAEKIISKFMLKLERTQSNMERWVTMQSIYWFMRDWTRVLVQSGFRIDRATSPFDNALDVIKPILKKRPVKERVKFFIKTNIIKLRNSY
ncbi:glycosyltransferase [Weissella halotolerans]|uniref:Family 2 glycosyltransferase n=1 Tax=Weissella halotolerans DSM 20190 TaxID=1123500 RepID=A0A0R2FS30_9LACO|nr:glycosyltransferase [Weissella halotolerans]KRN31273.1 family 2 glycosyltransferase [Weissella halotolerans DSM 20190]